MAVSELKRWTLDRCPDCSDDPALTHKLDEPVEVVAVPDLIEWLRERIGEARTKANEFVGVEEMLSIRATGESRAYQSVLDKLKGDE